MIRRSLDNETRSVGRAGYPLRQREIYDISQVTLVVAGGRVRTPKPMTPLASYAPVTSDAVFRATL